MLPARKKFIADVLRTAAQLIDDGVITDFSVIEQPDISGNKTMTITLQTGKLLRGGQDWLPSEPAPRAKPKRLRG
jgi:hypothetical protein